ncbi:MAG: protein kinase [Myxococcales bacterium]|nr:protein kinase [Myxococcales bacterium]
MSDRRHDVGLDPTVAPPSPDTAKPATLPGGHGAPALGATVGSAVYNAVDAHGETVAPTPLEAGHAATLAGPGVVTDFTSLPKVDSASYAIGPEIARGGMGKILSARDRRLRRDVVIKVTRHQGERIDPRFEREALITARLQHPSIVRVYEAGVLGDGRAFYAMERVRGRSLEVVLEETTTIEQRLALLPHAIAVADAIAYAHSEGVLHRDLKPSNVLVGPFGETVVIDWGLAKDLRAGEVPIVDEESATSSSGDASLTRVGSVLGTPSYMAPEQARGEAVDERTDIYALGALLYTLLAGAPPARGHTTDEVLDQVATGKRMKIGVREPRVPAELATIVEHAMAHDPANRYQNAKQLADELRQFAAGKLVGSHSYGLWHLMKRWLWRHRITVGVAAFAVVVLAVVAVISIKELDRRRAEAEEATITADNERVKAEREYARLLVKLARKALSSDPSQAAAILKGLARKPEALEWPTTLEVATEAGRLGMARVLEGHTNDVEHVIASPDDVHVATGSDDSTVRYWRVDDGTSVVFAKHTGPIETMTMSADGKYLATAGTDHEIYLWELDSGNARQLHGHSNTVRGVAFSPDGTRLASTDEDGRLFVWDVTSALGKEIRRHHHGLRPVVWNREGTVVIVGGYDGSIGHLDPITGKGEIVQAHAAELRTLVLSPDGKYLAAGDEDGVATLWTIEGTRIRTLTNHTDVVRDFVFTADGKHVVSAGGDNIVAVDDIPSGPGQKLLGNEVGVKDIDVSHDGKWIASAGIDGTVWVWPLTGGPGRRFIGHKTAVKAVSFTPGGLLISGAEDDRARIWRLDDAGPPPSGPALLGWLNQRTNLTDEDPKPRK